MLMALEIGVGLVLLTILTSLASFLAALALGYAITRDVEQRQVEVASTSRSSDEMRSCRRHRHPSVLIALVVVAALGPVALSKAEPPRECQRLCALDFESCKKSCADVGGFDGCEVECGWVNDGCLSECAEAQLLTDHLSAPPERGGGRPIDARSTR